MEIIKKSDLDAPAFELAVKALIDTNYRTYLNKYLSYTDIQNVLEGEFLDRTGDWTSFLMDLDLFENTINENGEIATVKKKDTSFDPNDIIQYIKTDFNDFDRSKLSVLNME
jgi:hypothetical protein